VWTFFKKKKKKKKKKFEKGKKVQKKNRAQFLNSSQPAEFHMWLSTYSGFSFLSIFFL
jgi:hypothetical protein